MQVQKASSSSVRRKLKCLHAPRGDHMHNCEGINAHETESYGGILIHFG